MEVKEVGPIFGKTLKDQRGRDLIKWRDGTEYFIDVDEETGHGLSPLGFSILRLAFCVLRFACRVSVSHLVVRSPSASSWTLTRGSGCTQTKSHTHKQALTFIPSQ